MPKKYTMAKWTKRRKNIPVVYKEIEKYTKNAQSDEVAILILRIGAFRVHQINCYLRQVRSPNSTNGCNVDHWFKWGHQIYQQSKSRAWASLVGDVIMLNNLETYRYLCK